MKNLEYQDRGYNTVTIGLAKIGGDRTFKIPVELKVVEIERLLELQTQLDKLHAEQVVNDGSAQLRMYWGYIYLQLEIIFKHYQEDVDVDYLKDNLMPTDAIRILNFFAENRFIEKPANTESSKKKI